MRRQALVELQHRIAAMEGGASKTVGIQADFGDLALDRHLLPSGWTAGVHDIVPTAPGRFAAAMGFLAACLGRLARSAAGLVVWCRPRGGWGDDLGRPCPEGLLRYGTEPSRLILVEPLRAREVLAALEESLAVVGRGGVAAVVGEVGRPGALDLTAARRLQLAAERAGRPLFLLRPGCSGEVGPPADTRWRIAPAPARPPPWGLEGLPGLGPPAWRIDLHRRRRAAGRVQVVMEWDDATLGFRLVADLADRSAGAPRPDRVAVAALRGPAGFGGRTGRRSAA